MKKILFLMLSASPFLANAQTAVYDLKGKIGTLGQPAKAFLIHREKGQNMTDSVALIAGTFEFKGNLSVATQALLLIDHAGTGLNSLGRGADVLNLYLENGTVMVNGKDSVKTAKITGSKLNDDNVKLAAAIKPVLDKAQVLSNQYQQAAEADRPKLADKFKDLQAEQKVILKAFIQQHPASFVSMDALRSFGGPSPSYSEVMPLFSTLAPAVQNSDNGKDYKTSIEKLRSTSVGSIAPDFTQNDPTGKPISLSSFKGKYVLLDFWASWCGPCRQENPNVVKAFNQYKSKNFTVLSVSLDKPEGKQAWLQAIKDDNLAWNHVSDLKFWNNDVAKLYGIQSIPGNFLIDPTGKIVAKDLRGDDLEQTLAQMLK